MLETPMFSDGRDVWDADGRHIRLRGKDFTSIEAEEVSCQIVVSVNYHDELVEALRVVLRELDREAKKRGDDKAFVLSDRREEFRSLLRRVGVKVRKPYTRKRVSNGRVAD